MRHAGGALIAAPGPGRKLLSKDTMLFEIARLSKESHFSTRSHWTRLAFRKISCISTALTAGLGTVEIDLFHIHQPTWTQRGHVFSNFNSRLTCKEHFESCTLKWNSFEQKLHGDLLREFRCTVLSAQESQEANLASILVQYTNPPWIRCSLVLALL